MPLNSSTITSGSYKNKTAVITGASSGIGLAIARKCAALGMNLALIDMVEADFSSFGNDSSIFFYKTDVSSSAMVQKTAEQIWQQFGGVHYVFNNAGIAAGSSVAETHPLDWEWVMSINLGGVMNVLQAFLPYLKGQREPSRIINTASVSAFLPYHSVIPYHVSKLGVLGISEVLFYELQRDAPQVTISVLCPGRVDTNITENRKLRPPHFEKINESALQQQKYRQLYDNEAKSLLKGMKPDKVADIVFEKIAQDKFYIFTDTEYEPVIRERMLGILEGKNPPDILKNNRHHDK